MLLIGLAVGVDYSLFYLKREREEWARGAGRVDALNIAAAASGRSVMISGITVMVAMAGVFLTGSAIFTGIGVATILVVACSVLGSLTVLPALMAWLGDRVEKGRIPLLHRRAARPSRFWSLVLGAVLRRPLVAAVVAGAALRRQALAGRMNEPISVRIDADHTVAVVSVPLAGDGEDETSQDALHALADQIVPRTLSTVSGVTAVVTGSTAGSVAFQDLLQQRTPWVFAFVLVLAFALQLVSFRSVVVAATAIVLNLLSVATAYGTLVLVFQHGWGKSLIGLDSTGPIVNWVPLFLFVILFGLSMDYHVFILSRIREGFDRGCSTWDAIASGVTSSAGVITSAAIIMVFVFATFVTLSTTNMKQIGLGLAVAVLLDATVVRALLLPAVMQLLDDRNWYLPLWLRWLPAVQQEGDPVALLTPQSWLPVGAGPADTAPGRGEHQENNWPSAVVSRDLVDGQRGSPVLDVMTTLPPNRRTEQSA